MIAELGRALLLGIHDEQLARHGGTPGVHDPALLEHAIAGPPAATPATTAEIVTYAASCALRIARRRPFIDGNTRTAFAALVTILALNGIAFDPPEVEASIIFLDMAGGEIEDAPFIAWVRRRAKVDQQVDLLWARTG